MRIASDYFFRLANINHNKKISFKNKNKINFSGLLDGHNIRLMKEQQNFVEELKEYYAKFKIKKKLSSLKFKNENGETERRILQCDDDLVNAYYRYPEVAEELINMQYIDKNGVKLPVFEGDSNLVALIPVYAKNKEQVEKLIIVDNNQPRYHVLKYSAEEILHIVDNK